MKNKKILCGLAALAAAAVMVLAGCENGSGSDGAGNRVTYTTVSGGTTYTFTVTSSDAGAAFTSQYGDSYELTVTAGETKRTSTGTVDSYDSVSAVFVLRPSGGGAITVTITGSNIASLTGTFKYDDGTPGEGLGAIMDVLDGTTWLHFSDYIMKFNSPDWTYREMTSGEPEVGGTYTMSGNQVTVTLTWFDAAYVGKGKVGDVFNGTLNDDNTILTFWPYVDSSLVVVRFTPGGGNIAAPEMVSIQPGTFSMGQEGIATPVHQVTISKGFSMGKYEVTMAQYAAVMWGCTVAGSAGSLPVGSVSWYEAIAFCNKLSLALGLTPAYSVSGVSDWASLAYDSIPYHERNTDWDAAECNWSATGYRLPTEAEWEYACRAGTTTVFNNGKNTINHSEANFYPFYGGYDENPDFDAIGTATAVGSYAPNAWGLYDMHGNVWEWCWDWYGGYASGAQTDPMGSASKAYSAYEVYSRVLRGGGWGGLIQVDAGGEGRIRLCSADRFYFSHWWPNGDMGFRLVRNAQ